MASRTKQTQPPVTESNVPASDMAPYQFRPAAPPPAKAGPGRKANPEMTAFVDSLEPLPVTDPKDGQTGWYETDVKDVSTFIRLLRTASNRLNCSFVIRHGVTIEPGQPNPGTVAFKKIPRRVRKGPNMT